MSQNATITHLDQALAEATVFYQKLRNFHWTVRGPQFFKLHDTFESLYDHWADLIDDIAERVMQLDGTPLRTLREVLEAARLRESAESPTARRMVEVVLADLASQVESYRGII